VELQKFKPENRAEQKLHDQWLRFLTEINEHTEKAPQELLAQPEIQEAVHYMEIGAFSKAELAAYDREKDEVMSARTLISDAKREGFEIGEEIGLAKGEVIGLAKGEEIGLAKGEEERQKLELRIAELEKLLTDRTK
jgi:predicted transposase YdaD